jgi:hypothetical protein
MKFENIRVYNFEHALRGMRNPKNSWHLSDSKFGMTYDENILDYAREVAQSWTESWVAQAENVDERDRAAVNADHINWLMNNGILKHDDGIDEYAFIGPKDMKLAKALIAGGSEHRKFLRQIMVTVDITAPLYWWKEFDTYKVGTVANSTSTMHKLTSKPITLDCFEIDDYDPHDLDIPLDGMDGTLVEVSALVQVILDGCENLRKKYLETNDKRYWKELVRWLPEGWLQTRTVTMTYENLLSMRHQREHHKLTEWSGTGYEIVTPTFIKFAQSLPYANDFIFCK